VTSDSPLEDQHSKLQHALVCPDCRKPLSCNPPDRSAKEPASLRCSSCGATFPVTDGVPRLWPPSRIQEIEASLAAFRGPHQGARENRFLRALLPPNPICDPGASGRIARIRQLMASGLVLNLGSKDAHWGDHVVNVDLIRGQTTNYVPGTSEEIRSLSPNFSPNCPYFPNWLLADIHRLPFADASVDSIICTNVLEHVADERVCLDEVARVLKPGGHVYISAPFIFPTHPDPLDRRRWTLDGLRHALSGFEELDAGVCGGPCSAFVAVTPTLLASVFSNFYLFNATRFFLGWLFWPLKWLDYVACRSSRAYMAAAACYFLGRKK
jgi:uncharacterized protein YbaR (Trm112 family)